MMCFPASAYETPDMVDLLLLIPIFALDFLCIHPFDDGNERISCLLIYRLKYIDIEMLTEETQDAYYNAFEANSKDWHEGTNDDMLFASYMFGIIKNAYKMSFERVEHLTTKGISKPERAHRFIEGKLGKVTKKRYYGGLLRISARRRLKRRWVI